MIICTIPLLAGSVTLRRARSEDAHRLQRFYNSLSHASKRTFRPMGWRAGLDRCRDVVNGNGTDSETRFDLFAVEEDRVVGWGFAAGLSGDTPGFGLGVSDHRQGLGLGRRLMSKVIQEVRWRGNAGISLCLVQDNLRARRLYESFGFRSTGARRGTDGLRYTDMRLDLASEEGAETQSGSIGRLSVEFP